MSSEYLGWTERKPPREFDYTRFDRDVIPGGPITHSFENYVKNIFRPNTAAHDYSGNNIAGNSSDTVGGGVGDHKNISAASMLRMEQILGKEALDDSYHEVLQNSLDFMPARAAPLCPLDAIYNELSAKGYDTSERRHYPATSQNSATSSYSQFPVYKPKCSSEYYSTRQNVPDHYQVSIPSRVEYRTYKEESDAEWKKNNRQMLVDYKDFESSPLSPYMYQAHPYIQRQDSRIVGSNFVQVTTRPRDRFLDKLDRTLAEVRNSPRYTH